MDVVIVAARDVETNEDDIAVRPARVLGIQPTERPLSFEGEGPLAEAVRADLQGLADVREALEAVRVRCEDLVR